MPVKKGFECKNCRKWVNYKAWGTKNRNHCPYCLYSLHIDIRRGDRSSDCGGLMKPIGIFKKEDGEEMLIHVCEKCGIKRKNRIAGDDSVEVTESLPVLKNF